MGHEYDVEMFNYTFTSPINKVLPLFEALRQGKVCPMVYGKYFLPYNSEFDLTLDKILLLLKEGKELNTCCLYQSGLSMLSVRKLTEVVTLTTFQIGKTGQLMK